MKTNAELYDLENESNLLASLLTYARVLDEVRDLLCADCFTSTFHRNIYTAALTLSERGEPVDVITITNELGRMGAAGSTTPYDVLALSGAIRGDYYYSAQVLFELFSRRRAWEIGQKLIAKITDRTLELSDVLEEATTSLSDVFALPSANISTIGDAARELYEGYINKNLSGETELTGAPTGFEAFDMQSGGLHPGNLIIVAAETSQGKTSFALSAALTAARHEHPVAIYSLEMGKAELMARIAACETDVPVGKLLYGRLNELELSRVDLGVSRLAKLPVYFDDQSTSNIDVILSSIRSLVAKHGVRGVMIDYLQILNVNMKAANKEQQMADVARRLKNLAKDLGIWIVALSQLSRDHANHLPTLNRLRDSGQIAEAADIVVLLYRPEVYGASYPHPFKDASVKGTALASIAKGRNIGLNSFLLAFDAPTTRFGELAFIPSTPKEEEEEEPF